MGNAFGNTPTLEEQVETWIEDLNIEISLLDNDIYRIEGEEENCLQQTKRYIRKKQPKMIELYAKNILQNQAAIRRLTHAKVQMTAIVSKMLESMSQMRVMNAFKQNAYITTQMNKLFGLRGISEKFKTIKKEMARAGYIQDMISEQIDDAFDDVTDTDVDDAVKSLVEQLTQEELQKVNVQHGGLLPEHKRGLAELDVLLKKVNTDFD